MPSPVAKNLIAQVLEFFKPFKLFKPFELFESAA